MNKCKSYSPHRAEKNCPPREILEIKTTFSVTLMFDPFPVGYPVQSILPLLLQLLHNIGINPKGIQFTIAADGTVLFSFIAFPKQINAVYALFGATPFVGTPLTSIPALAALANLLPIGSTPPEVDYSVIPELFFIFACAPSAEYRLRLLNTLSTLGTLEQFSVIGDLGVATFLNTILPIGSPEDLQLRVNSILGGRGGGYVSERPIPRYF
nr:putative membrane protein [Cedratvirus lena]